MWRLFSCLFGTGIAVMKEVTPRFCPSVSHSLLSWCSSCSTPAGAVGRWSIGIVWPLRIRRPDQERLIGARCRLGQSRDAAGGATATVGMLRIPPAPLRPLYVLSGSRTRATSHATILGAVGRLE